MDIVGFEERLVNKLDEKKNTGQNDLRCGKMQVKTIAMRVVDKVNFQG